MRRYLAPAVTIAACLMVVVLGVRIVQVHDRYGQWRVAPTVTPLRIAALGRDFDRSATEARCEPRWCTSTQPKDFEIRGSTDEGYGLLVPRALHGRTPVVIYIEDDESRFWSYALVGGP